MLDSTVEVAPVGYLLPTLRDKPALVVSTNPPPTLAQTPANAPVANYVTAVRTGNLLYLAGKGPGLPGKKLPVGKVGRDLTVEQAYEIGRAHV